MRTITISLLASVLLLGIVTSSPAATSSTGLYEIDGSLGFGTGPANFDMALGLNFGAGYYVTPDKNIQGRIDLTWFDFKKDELGQTLDYTRIPLLVSARYYMPLNKDVKLFGQAGLEISFDSFDSVDSAGKHSKSETHIGITPGAGAEYYLMKDVSVFALGLFHIITDNYFSMQFGAVYHF